MSTIRFISDLAGTMMSYFRFGNLRLKDNSGVLEAKNKLDGAYVNVSGASMVLNGAGGATTLVPNAAASGLSFTLPAADGSTSQALVTNGSGVLSFATVATGNNAVKSQTEQVAFGTSSPVAVFTPPADAVILKVIVDVDTAFNGTTPTLTVGISGDTAKYMGSGDNDLKTVAVYEVAPLYEEDGTPDAITITYSASGSTAGLCYVTVEYANPS